MWVILLDSVANLKLRRLFLIFSVLWTSTHLQHRAMLWNIYLVRQLAAVTNKAMDYLENNRPIPLSSLDNIAQNIETIACLRGDSNIYELTRPEGLVEYQKEMYAIEDALRSRLFGLGYKYPPPRSLSEFV